MSDRIKAVAIAEDKQHENFVLWVCDSYAQIVQKAAEMYMESHENVTLNVVGKTMYELREDFALKFAAGEPLPDVLLVDDDTLKEYITLQDELQRDMFRTWDDLIDPSSYVTSRVADVTIDGKMYGCPFTSAPIALYYNKHMLSETYGIDELPDDLTWDDFIDYGKRIKEQTGAFLLPSINNHITNILVRSTGSLFYNESGEIEPDNVAPILSLAEELTVEELISDVSTEHIDETVWALLSESVFSVIGAPYWFTEIKKYVDEHNMDMEWDVVRLPKSDGLPYDVNYGGCSWMVMNNENTETSETVIDFLVQSFSQENTTSQEIVGMAAGQYDVVPPFERVWGVINSLDNNGCFHGRPVIKYLMEMSPDIPPFMIGYRFDQLSQRFYEIVHTIASGLTTAEDGLIDFSHYCLELPPLQGEELNYIVIEREPDKTDYFRNDTFSRDGMIVRAYFTDGTDQVVENYSVSPWVLFLNNDSVEVSYESGGVRKTATQSVTVTDRQVTDVTAEAAKNVYLHTNTLTTSDFSVRVKYNRGDDTHPLKYGMSPATLGQIGSQEVAISFYDVRSVDDTGTNYDGVAKYECTVTIDVIRKLCSIEINDDRVLKTYSIGQTFCPDGLDVTAHYSDGTSEKVQDLRWKKTPFTEVNPTQEVCISYTENGVTASGIVFVSVEDQVLESISTSGTIRTKYIVGDILDVEDMRVIAHYTNGNEREVYHYSIDKTDILKKDDQEFTVQYREGEITASVQIPIEVLDKKPTDLRISSPFGGPRCLKGTSASASGMEVEVLYSGLTWKEVANSRLDFSPSICEEAGTQNVTVSYTETCEIEGETKSVTVSKTVTVTVDNDCLEAMHVIRQPSTRRYYVGDPFSPAGMVCVGTYGNGVQKNITEGIEYSGEGVKFYPGVDHVTVSCDYYNDGQAYTTQVPVTVLERGVDNSIKGQTELTYDCDAGQARVNLFHGRLTFEHPDVSIGFNKTSISCSHVYNSMFEEETSLKHDAGYYRTGMGIGFKLSIQQYLFRDGTQNRYIYVDADGYRHHFWPLNETKYYDTMGTDLILTVSGNQYYMEDSQGNRLDFEHGVLVKATSCFENGQEQHFDYNENGQLIAAYVAGNSAHKLQFEYDAAGMLVSLRCTNGVEPEKILTFTYEQKTTNRYRLTAISDGHRTARFRYREEGLASVVDSETRSCMLFTYGTTFRKNSETDSGAVLGKIFNPMTRIIVGTAADPDAYFVSIPNENIIKCNQFRTDKNRFIVTVDSSRGSSSVTDEKVTVGYYMNTRGFTTAVLETSGGNLRSMEKLPGIRVSLISHKKGGEKTPKQKAAEQTEQTKQGVTKWDAGPENAINCTSVFCGSADDLYLFAENCKELTEYRKGKCASNVHFMLSFWIKLGRVLEDPRLNIQIGSKGLWLDKIHTDFTQAVLDNSAIDVWQYVSIPVNITERNIKYLAIQPEDSCLNGMAIADVRLCPSASSGWYVSGANGSAPLNRVSTITYTLSDGTPGGSSVGKHCFMTDEDLRATFSSMYRSRPAGGKLSTSSAFMLSLCSGTVKKWVTDATLVTSEWINGDWQKRTCPLTMEVVAASGTEPEHGVPSFYHETISPDDTLTVKSSMMFYPAMTVGDYTGDVIRAYTEATTGGKNGKRSETSLYSDFCGRTLREVDEYGVVTTYSYDAAGDLRKKSVSHPETEETLAYEVTNGFDSIVEKTGVSYQKTDYDGFWGDPVSTAYRGADESAPDGTLQSIYTYDARRRLTSVANNLGDRNLLTYADGRLRTVSAADGASQSLYSYRVEYDRYGDPAQIFLRNSLSEAEQKLIQKETDRANGKIITKQYRDGEDTPDTVEIALDRYGRTACIRESSAGDGECYQTDFRRQSLDESDGAAEVTYMYDPYEKRRYTYHYDDYNQCTGYSATSGVGDFSVRRTEPDTVTYFENTRNNRSSTVTYDDTRLMSPRVTVVNDFSGQFQRSGTSIVPSNIGQVRYRYDPLGRISGKTIQATYSSETNLISVSREYLPGTTLKKNIEVSCPLYGGGNYGCSFRYEFDARGRITKEISGSKTVSFTYDLADRLTGETIPTVGRKQYTYHADGSIASETLASGQIIVYTYDRGRLVSRGSETYGYDAIGNCTTYRGTTLTWHRGNRLQKFGENVTYRYDNQGVRFEKVVGGTVTHFLRDGAKLVDELRGNIRIRYLYDAEEMIGFYCNGNYYYYVKDGLGNVRSILYAKKNTPLDRGGTDSYEISEVARYDYDAWGNCTATPVGSAEISGVSVADFNPIRWRSQYYDRESGLYYIGGRYYSPVTKQFLSAANVETVVANAAEIYGLNLYSLTVANPVNLGFGGYTIETNTPLAYDPPELNWWEKFWQSTAGKFVAVSLVVIAAVLCALTGQLGLFLMTAGSVAASLVIGASIAGYQSYACGRGFWRGFEQYIDGNWAQSAAIASFTLIVTVGVQAIAAAIRNAGSKRALANIIGERDGVVIQRANRADFTDEAWREVQSLQHNANGETISNVASGRKIHRGFKADLDRLTVRGGGRVPGAPGYLDAYNSATNTIYELKPNNARSINMGIKQLHRYEKALLAKLRYNPTWVLVVY